MIPDNTFDHIDNRALRAFNRVMFAENLLADKGLAYADDYIKKMDEQGKADMFTISKALKKYGERYVRETVTKDMRFPEYL